MIARQTARYWTEQNGVASDIQSAKSAARTGHAISRRACFAARVVHLRRPRL